MDVGLFAAATELWLMWAKERWPGNAAEPDIIVEGSGTATRTTQTARLG